MKKDISLKDFLEALKVLRYTNKQNQEEDNSFAFEISLNRTNNELKFGFNDDGYGGSLKGHIEADWKWEDWNMMPDEIKDFVVVNWEFGDDGWEDAIYIEVKDMRGNK